MITNSGKEIISKFLLGQVPSYATHLAIGCGAKPLNAGGTLPNAVYSKERLDFEMTRVPISSKGFVDDSETFTVISRVLNANEATLTTSVEHGIIAGENIIVSVNDVAYDGHYTVYSTTPTTITYKVVALNQGTNTSTGAVTVSRTKVSLTAELPTENRYEITEIGLFSQGTNVLASQYDSRNIFDFSQSWQLHNTAITDLPIITSGTGAIDIPDNTTSPKAFFMSSSDSAFAVNNRKTRGEGPRNLNSTLLVRGDLSTISGAINGDWTVSSDSSHIHLNGINFDISGNNASDILKLAFSVLDKTGATTNPLTDVRILMEFYKTELTTTSGYAKAQIYVPGANYLNSYRYYVANMSISQSTDPDNPTNSVALPYVRFYTSSDFSPSEIRVCRIFVQITASPNAQSHYVCFDGFRIENTTENPLYKMSGYSVIRNTTGVPVVKLPNTNNYVDFRFGLGVS